MEVQVNELKRRAMYPRWHGKSMVEEMDELFVKMYKSVHEEE